VPPWPPRRRWSDSSDLRETVTPCSSSPKWVFSLPETRVRRPPKSLYGRGRFACATSAVTAVRFHPFCTLADGTHAGILHFEIPLEWFADKVHETSLPGASSYLMDRDGHVLVHNALVMDAPTSGRGTREHTTSSDALLRTTRPTPTAEFLPACRGRGRAVIPSASPLIPPRRRTNASNAQVDVAAHIVAAALIQAPRRWKP